MSAKAPIKTTTLYAHVPVDSFDIVNGPCASRFAGIIDELARYSTPQNGYYVNQTFALRTDASSVTFTRRLQIACILGVMGDDVSFTAIFSGRIVSGFYDMKNRTGWFNLD